MSSINQNTVDKAVSFEGVGLHTGVNVSLKILPAEPNTGVYFKRIDLIENNIIYPSIFNVTNTDLSTTISNEKGVKVSTIEHLMSALHLLNIDNAIIEVNNVEIPILDGSSKNFVEKIQEAGIKSSNVPIKVIKINNKINVVDENKEISIEPTIASLKIDYEINFKNPLINKQENSVNVYEDNLSEILESRTFCLYEDIEKLKSRGLAKGGSLENAIVVDGNKILNDEPLRNKKEFVNHKILDCIGDLYLSGYKLIGHIKCSQGGHKLTNQLLRKIFEDESNFSIIEVNTKNLPKTLIRKTQLKVTA